MKKITNTFKLTHRNEQNTKKTFIFRCGSQHNIIFLGRSASGPKGPPLFRFQVWKSFLHHMHYLYNFYLWLNIQNKSAKKPSISSNIQTKNQILKHSISSYLKFKTVNFDYNPQGETNFHKIFMVLKSEYPLSTRIKNPNKILNIHWETKLFCR